MHIHIIYIYAYIYIFPKSKNYWTWLKNNQRPALWPKTTSILVLRWPGYSDVAPEFEAAMSELKIPLDHSLPGKPNNNSLAERTNQEIINTVSTAMLHAGLPAQYWNFALNCVTHKIEH